MFDTEEKEKLKSILEKLLILVYKYADKITKVVGREAKFKIKELTSEFRELRSMIENL